MMQEKIVGLRAVIESDLDLFDSLKTKRNAEPYQWFGFSSSKELRGRFLWTIAIALLRERRGRGVGTEAQRQLVDYLFRNTRMERIQAFTDVENAAERRSLEKVGFTVEGVLRSAQWHDGGWHDQVLCSILRADWSQIVTAPHT